MNTHSQTFHNLELWTSPEEYLESEDDTSMNLVPLVNVCEARGGITCNRLVVRSGR